LKVGYLTSASATHNTVATLKSALASANVKLVVVAERLGEGIDQTYSVAFAGLFDAIVVDGSASALFAPTGSLANSNMTATYGNKKGNAFKTLYPAGRPLQILQDGYHWGKAVAVVGSNSDAFKAAGIQTGTPGVYHFVDSNNTIAVVEELSDALHTFKFLDRYPLDE
jgi:catalase